MLALALFNRVDSIVLRGDAINMIKGDPAIREFQGSIMMDNVYTNPKLYKEAYDFEVTRTRVQLGGDRSPADMLIQFISPNSVDTAKTWESARNPLTWMLRTAAVSARGHVTKDGEVTVQYYIDDSFDLRPDWVYRGIAYNIASTVLGALWHEGLGASEPYVEAKWKQTTPPLKPLIHNKNATNSIKKLLAY